METDWFFRNINNEGNVYIKQSMSLMCYNGNTLEIHRSNQDQNAPFSNQFFVRFVLWCVYM